MMSFPILERWLNEDPWDTQSGREIPLIVRPSIDSEQFDAAIQHTFRTLSFGVNWPGRIGQHIERLKRWDGKSEIVLFLSPFVRYWDGEKELPQLMPKDRELVWTAEEAELQRVHRRLAEIADVMTSQAKDRVVVSYDFERYGKGMHAARERLYPTLRRIAQSLFPDCSIEWYDFGGTRPIRVDGGWATTERYDNPWMHVNQVSVPLYTVNDWLTTREQMRRTLMEFPDCTITPWLGQHYTRDSYHADVVKRTEPIELPKIARIGREITSPKHCRLAREAWERVRRVWWWTASGKDPDASYDHELDLDDDGVMENIETSIVALDALRKGALGKWN